MCSVECTSQSFWENHLSLILMAQGLWLSQGPGPGAKGESPRPVITRLCLAGHLNSHLTICIVTAKAHSSRKSRIQ